MGLNSDKTSTVFCINICCFSTRLYIFCTVAQSGFESDGNAQERRSRSFFIQRERRSRCFFTARCYAQARYMPSPGVCPSVTFVSCAKTNKDIFEFFSPSGSHTILVFPHQTGWRCSDRNPPNGGVECKGYEKWRFSTNISLYRGLKVGLLRWLCLWDITQCSATALPVMG